MTNGTFETHVQTVETVLIEALETYMQANDMKFEIADFLSQTSVSLNDLARESLFFGANIFPML